MTEVFRGDVRDYLRRALAQRIAEGWQDDEILDHIDRTWDYSGQLVAAGPGRSESGHYGTTPLRFRRAVEDILAELRGEAVRRSRSTRRRGRPKGSRTIPRDQIVNVYRDLRTNYGRPPTQAELAANLKPKIEVRTLQDHLDDYELSWPIE